MCFVLMDSGQNSEKRLLIQKGFIHRNEVGFFGHKMVAVILIKWMDFGSFSQFVDRSIFINYLIKHLAEKM